MEWQDLLRKAVRAEGSQAEVARKLGVSPSTVSQILSNRYPANPEAMESKVMAIYGGKIMEQVKVPDGFKMDAMGRLIPIKMIKEIDLSRDDLVEEIVGKAKNVSGVLNDFKGKALGDIEAFVALSAEKYGAKLGGRKGNVTLTSFDGKYRIIRAVSDLLEFDERLQAARALIDECIKEWTEDSRDEVLALIDSAFYPDRSGRVNAKRIMGLRRLKIDDEKWRRAMEALADSLQVTGSRTYLRIYERVGNTDEYRQIGLDVVAA
jgi:hypothetical protein